MGPESDTTIQWSAAYELGYSRIDGEHRYLVKLVGDAVTAIDDGSSEQVAGLITRFIEACRYHFFSEEQLMRDIGYEHIDIHIEYHTKLLDMADVLAQRCASSETHVMLRDDVITLAQCLLDDVISGDRSLLPYLQREGLI